MLHDNMDNEIASDALGKFAAEKQVRPSHLAIAWVLAKGRPLVPVVGARTRAQLADSLAALGIRLSTAALTEIQEAITPSSVAGTRYDEHQMRMLAASANPQQ